MAEWVLLGSSGKAKFASDYPVPSPRLLLPAAWVLATRFKSGVFCWRPNPRLTAQLGGSIPQLSPATPSRSQSRNSTALSGHATPPETTPSTRPLHRSSLGPVGGSTRLRPSQSQGSVKQHSTGLPFAKLCLRPCSLARSGTHSDPLQPRGEAAHASCPVCFGPPGDEAGRELRVSALPVSLTLA